jgi:hypothetical protein
MHRLIITLGCALVLSGCQTTPQPFGKPELLSDMAALQQEVQKHIAGGMSVDRAKTVMEENGFHCEYLIRDRCLRCELPKTGRWTGDVVQVKLDYDERRTVTDIRVDTYRGGL